MTTASAQTFAVLREFARARTPIEWCDMCAAPLAPTHDHLLDPETQHLQCACLACVHLLGGASTGRRTLVRRRVRRLPNFDLSDDGWRALGLPVDLAFFVRRSVPARVVALYPSPGGPVESTLALAAWAAVVAANPCLAELRPDVEALLVRRAGARRDHYLVSIDACYRLVGLLRLHWRDFSGGAEVQDRIEQFFAELDAAGRDA